MTLRGLIGVATAALALALPAAAPAGEGSLYGGPGPRPGPDILYAPAPRAPQLENTGIWQAPPILVSGATAYRDGEFLYQDFLYDDHGARGSRDPSDPRSGSTGGDSFSTPYGTYTYPTAAAYANNAADVVELRVKPIAGATAFRITFNTMLDPSLVATTIAIGSSALPQAFPHGANTSAPAELFLHVRGSSAELLNAVTKATVGPAPSANVDMERRQIEVRVPHAAWNPGTSTVRMASGTGLWDAAAGRYLLPQTEADETHPGGRGALAAPSAFFNAGFRTGEPLPEVRTALTAPAWWRDRAQGDALRSGDLSTLFAEVDFGKLAAGAGDESGVPRDGPLNRILASRFETKQGRDYSVSCQEQTLPDSCLGWLRGQLQPYAVYVPRKPQPAGGYGLTLLLHSLAAGYNQFTGSRNQSQLGERGSGSIVITPAGRGPDGWYYDHAGADTFEVWADVARHYDLDPDWTSISGYSMGGYGTYKLATQFPDLFARANPVVGPPGVGVWAPGVLEPSPGGRSSNTYYQLESLRHIPFLMWVGSGDELVPIASTQAQADRFDALGLRYAFDVFTPADHFALAINDQYEPAAAFLGTARVDRNPAHVSYVVNPEMDFPGVSFVADHAYWLSGLRVRDAKGMDPRGKIDVLSEGFGQDDPQPGGTQRGGGTLTGGSIPAIPYTRQSKSWRAAGAGGPRRNRLVIDAQNVRAVTIDPGRARVTCRAELDVATDGPLTVTLAGCNRTVRFRPSCVPARQRVGSRGIGRVRLGQRKSTVARRAGTPSRQKRRVYRYCVRRGGKLLVVFSPRGSTRLVVTTARRHRARGVRRGTTVRRFRRAYPRARRSSSGVYLTSRSSRIVVGTRRGRVRFVAVADRRLVKKRGLLRSHLREAGLVRRR